MNSSKQKGGAVAASSKEAVQAAYDVLKAGGNAFDAAIAATWMTFVSEPTMTSAGGGGFMTARVAGGQHKVFDFYHQTPQKKRSIEDLELFPVFMENGGASHSFHTGIGSCAVPGNVAGLFHIHAQLGRIPMRKLMYPAIRKAREGIKMSEYFIRSVNLVRPAFVNSDSGRALFQPKYRDLRKGDTFRNMQFADILEVLAKKGPAEFYKGEIAEWLTRDCRLDGGCITMEDLAQYEVIEREPMVVPYSGHQIITNPAPSIGGSLLAHTLKLLEGESLEGIEFGSAEYLQLMTDLLRFKNDKTTAIFDDGVLAASIDKLKRSIDRMGTTTHITVADHQDNIACITTTVGEGSGYVIPKTGILMNNMLSEGFSGESGQLEWEENQRMTSMLAPTLVLKDERPVLALGTGGANRISSALSQVLINYINLDMHPADAVESPRIHWDFEKLDVESGFKRSSLEKIQVPDDVEKIAWSQKAFYFGGINAIFFDDKGKKTPVADSRRNGLAKVL